MTKEHLKLLERIWAREIAGTLPLQSKAAGYELLEKDGYVEKYTRNLGVDRFGTLKVTGWALTQLGRLTYCQSCKDVKI